MKTEQQKTEEMLLRMAEKSEVIADLFRLCMPKQANWRYFSRRGSKNRFFWTTEKATFKNKQRYISGIYRYVKSRDEFIRSKAVGHAKRKDAKQRALRLFNQ